MLSDEQKDQLDARLEQTWTGSRACPICGRDNWNRIDMIFEQKAAERPEGEAEAATMPLIYMSCFFCGYVISFNAVTLKLVHPLLRRAEIEENEMPQIGHISDILKLSGESAVAERHESVFPEPDSPSRAQAQTHAHSHSKHDAHILEMHVDSLMNQSLNFMILGGLVSLIAIGNGSDAFLHTYLSKIVWYFLAAIFVYFLTSSKESSRGLAGLLGEKETDAVTGATPKHIPAAQHTLKLLTAVRILVLLFIASFILHFYIFAMGKMPLNAREEVFFNAALIAAGLALYAFSSARGGMRQRNV